MLAARCEEDGPDRRIASIDMLSSLCSRTASSTVQRALQWAKPGGAAPGRAPRSLGLAGRVGADHMAAGNRMTTHTYTPGSDLHANLVACRSARPTRQSLWREAPMRPTRQSLWRLPIPVRVVRRATRTKASAPPRPRTLGACAAPRPPRPPHSVLRADEGSLQQRSFCGLCKMIKGSGGIIPPAAGGGPKPSSDEERRYGSQPRAGEQRGPQPAPYGNPPTAEPRTARKDHPLRARISPRVQTATKGQP